MKKILSLTLLFISMALSAQENVCDCVQIGIETLQCIQKGESEEIIEKRFEKQNKRCEELSQKIGSDFEKKMASCENFPEFIKLMAGGNNSTKTNPDVCKCVDLSIQILKELGQEASEEEINKLYQKESERCEELSTKLGEEKFGLQMMNCENFGILMEILMRE